MSEARLIETREVGLDEIEVGRRLRPLTEATVAALMASIEEMGTSLNAITLRRKAGQLVLVAGGHRLEAHRRLGRAAIRADIWDCTMSWARLAEIDENLASADLSTLEMAVFLAERKRVYEDLHPETKRGGDRFGDQTDTVSFCSNIAEKRDISERHVRRLVEIGANLEPASIAALETFERPLSFRELKALSECNADQQAQAIASMTGAPGVKPIDAITMAVNGRGTLSEQAVEPDRIAAKIVEAFDRAPMPAKRLVLAALAARHARLAAEYFGGDG